jgi:hypothetical protein
MTRQGTSGSTFTGQEVSELPPIRDLLERAGFRIRSTNRADCAHCLGSSIRTVSYTQELAHCFRCGWAANRLGLAKHLGLLADDSATRHKFRRDRRHRRATASILRLFERWREGRIRQLSAQSRVLGRQALLAHEVLLRWPAGESAWDALARFYHAEAHLSAALDFLSFAKASNWLERDSTPMEVFETWRELHAAA